MNQDINICSFRDMGFFLLSNDSWLGNPKIYLHNYFDLTSIFIWFTLIDLLIVLLWWENQMQDGIKKRMRWKINLGPLLGSMNKTFPQGKRGGGAQGKVVIKWDPDPMDTTMFQSTFAIAL